ncbi:MAG: MFS transporter, partial [Planctomycetes bacterium]|nr:MFS transporter [Planctomycetota bacterium]
MSTAPSASTSANQAGDPRATASGSRAPGAGGAWAPLRERLFRSLWIANLASQVGTWVHEIGAAWLMASLSPSPLWIALVQAAGSFPLFLLALPAGALADLFDRRVMLLWAQAWMLLGAAVLAATTFAGVTGPLLLLLGTFALGLGTAIAAPAWASLTPELVSRARLPAAIALQSLAVNLARSVGPALGGFLVAAWSPGAAFALNALSFLGVLWVLARWKRPRPAETMPRESFGGALRAGLRYALHAPPLRIVLVRAGAFIVPASALWALLPSLARYELAIDAATYGVLLGAFGIGAVLGALLLPRWRKRFSAHRLVQLAGLVYAASLVGLAELRSFLPLALAMGAAGGAWLSTLSTLNVAAQTSVHDWVRARALSLYGLVFFGALALGSSGWGALAELLGLAWSFRVAAFLALLGVALSLRAKLAPVPPSTLAPSRHWPMPTLDFEPHAHDGPVEITLEYRVPLDRQETFLALLDERRSLRLR